MLGVAGERWAGARVMSTCEHTAMRALMWRSVADECLDGLAGWENMFSAPPLKNQTSGLGWMQIKGAVLYQRADLMARVRAQERKEDEQQARESCFWSGGADEDSVGDSAANLVSPAHAPTTNSTKRQTVKKSIETTYMEKRVEELQKFLEDISKVVENESKLCADRYVICT